MSCVENQKSWRRLRLNGFGLFACIVRFSAVHSLYMYGLVLYKGGGYVADTSET